ALASGQLGTHAGAASAPTIGISARIVAGAAAVVACACAANGNPAASARASRIRLRIDTSPEDTKPEGCCNPEPAATVTAGPCGAATVALSLPAAHPDSPPCPRLTPEAAIAAASPSPCTARSAVRSTAIAPCAAGVERYLRSTRARLWC